MKSLREARRAYWNRYRAIAMRHRPLPERSYWIMQHEDALLGLQLDEVLEGPEQVPA